MQGVNPIGQQVFFSPPQIAVGHVKDKPVVELRALEKGPEATAKSGLHKSESDISLIQQLKLGQLESTPSKVDIHAEIRDLRAKAQSDNIQSQRDAVAGFARMAKNSSESVRNYGLMGMMSILRLSENTGILSSVSSSLILLLDPSLMGEYQSDMIRFSMSMMVGLSNKFDQLPKTQQQAILQRLTQNVEKIKNPDLKSAIREFIKEPTGFRARMESKGEALPVATQAAATQVPSLAGNAGALVSRIVEKQQSVLEQIALVEPDALDMMAVIFSNAKLNLLSVYGESAFSDPVLIYALGYLDTVSREIVEFRRRKKQKTLAFVTHFSAVLPREILEKYPIFVVKEEDDQGIRQYHELFNTIREQGYKHIVVLMPHADHWLSYHHAKHAAHKLENVVHVVDTELFGLGLGLLLQELCPLAMKSRSVKALMGLVARLVKSINYWVVPLKPGSMKNQLWYQKMNRKSVIYDSAWENQIPVILLSHQAGIVSRSATPTGALLDLQTAVQVKPEAPLKLIIEHRDLLPEASALGRYFQQQFPHCEITIASTSLHLGNEWGPFIGVAVLYP